MDVDIQEEEIRTVLKELDKDGNGEIDFDEFLYCMTATDRYLDMLAEGEGKCLLFLHFIFYYIHLLKLESHECRKLFQLGDALLPSQFNVLHVLM